MNANAQPQATVPESHAVECLLPHKAQDEQDLHNTQGSVITDPEHHTHYRVELLNRPDQWTVLRTIDDHDAALRWADNYVAAWDDGRKVRAVLVQCSDTVIWRGQADGVNMFDVAKE